MEIFLKAETDEELERVIRYNIGKADHIRKELKVLSQSPVLLKESVSLVEQNNARQIELEEKELNEEYLYYYSNMLEDLNDSITEEDKKDAVLSNLPTITNKNYLNIINRIKLELLKEIHELDELKELEDDLEFSDEIEKEKSKIQEILNVISNSQNLTFDNVVDSNVLINNNLVFLQTPGGATYAENDLYSISEEYYDLFKDLILSIESGSFKNVKQFSSNNTALKGFSEVRDFKTRVVFRRINKNTYAIIDIFVKKSDNDKGYLEALKTRVDYFRKNKVVIMEQLKDDNYLEQQQVIRNNLIQGLTDKNIVKTMKRG